VHVLVEHKRRKKDLIHQYYSINFGEINQDTLLFQEIKNYGATDNFFNYNRLIKIIIG
jgi:hypothetical protein